MYLKGFLRLFCFYYVIFFIFILRLMIAIEIIILVLICLYFIYFILLNIYIAWFLWFLDGNFIFFNYIILIGICNLINIFIILVLCKVINLIFFFSILFIFVLECIILFIVKFDRPLKAFLYVLFIKIQFLNYIFLVVILCLTHFKNLVINIP